LERFPTPLDLLREGGAGSIALQDLAAWADEADFAKK